MTDVGPMKTAGNYRIMIYGPKEDGTYVVEFSTDGHHRGRNCAIPSPD
jgi:hypothetical protein